MAEVNKTILDGSNEEASKRLDEMIKDLEKKDNINRKPRRI